MEITIKTSLSAEFLPPRNRHYPLDMAYSLGPKTEGNLREGFSFVWFGKIDQEKTLVIQRENEPSTKRILLTSPSVIEEFDFTFDQNGQLVYCYQQNNQSYLYTWNSLNQSYETKEFPNTRNPKVSLDDVRNFTGIESDIIFAYMKDTELMCRYQRDRFDEEHQLWSFPRKKILWRIGMTNGLRFGFQTR